MHLDQVVFYWIVCYLEVPYKGNAHLGSEQNVRYNEVSSIK